MHNAHFCANCHRIKLTSQGMLRPCLLDDSGSVDLLPVVEGGGSDAELE